MSERPVSAPIARGRQHDPVPRHASLRSARRCVRGLMMNSGSFLIGPGDAVVQKAKFEGESATVASRSPSGLVGLGLVRSGHELQYVPYSAQPVRRFSTTIPEAASFSIAAS